MVINTNNDVTPKTASQSGNKLGTANTSSETKHDSNTSADTKDQVQLSQEAQSFTRLESKIQESSGVDKSKVEDIKQRIESGNYSISNENIADKILQHDYSLR